MKAGQCEKLMKVWETYEKELDDQEKFTSSEIEQRKERLYKMVDEWYNNAASLLKNNCWQVND